MSDARRWIAAALGLAAAVALGGAIVRAQRSPRGPQPIAYDREACHHCHMAIGDPGFAAQAQLADGEVLDFDDPGCLLAWRVRTHSAVRALYFHHLHEARWLTQAEVGFVPVAQSPMGWGFGAVARDAPGAVSFEAALAQVRTREVGDVAR